MAFSRSEYWKGWPCPPPGDLPDPGMEQMRYLLWLLLVSITRSLRGEILNFTAGLQLCLKGATCLRLVNWRWRTLDGVPPTLPRALTSGCPRWWHAGIAGCTLPLVEGVAPRVVLAYETFWTLIDWDGWNDKGVSSTQDSNYCKYCGGEHLKEKERDHVGFLRCSEITCNTPDCPIIDVLNMGKFWGRSQSLLEMGPVESPRMNFDASRSLLHLHPHLFFYYSLMTHILVMVLYLWTRVLNFVKNRLSFTGLTWKTSLLQNQRLLEWEVVLSFLVQSSCWI